ncbi:hypothetical protein V7148_22030 [Gottfriedia acidiceleris]|uniref:hypothetical protein n=1 Tax=Bacillaceae TaxID=186817 RepID=UPI000BF9EA28|nr:hypothetical protein [Bacillus sp. AFS077874]PFM82564.1 hypothetical protein COJ46_01755 [Bacillus sp. AFS077874]
MNAKSKKFALLLVVIFISILGVLYTKSFMNEKEKTRNLKYKVADATTDYFGDGRYQIKQFDPNGDYYVKDMKSSFLLFISNIKAYKKIGNQVYFIHKEGYTILDYKNNNNKRLIKF